MPKVINVRLFNSAKDMLNRGISARQVSEKLKISETTLAMFKRSDSFADYQSMRRAYNEKYNNRKKCDPDQTELELQLIENSTPDITEGKKERRVQLLMRMAAYEEFKKKAEEEHLSVNEWINRTLTREVTAKNNDLDPEPKLETENKMIDANALKAKIKLLTAQTNFVFGVDSTMPETTRIFLNTLKLCDRMIDFMLEKAEKENNQLVS